MADINTIQIDNIHENYFPDYVMDERIPDNYSLPVSGELPPTSSTLLEFDDNNITIDDRVGPLDATTELSTF